MKKKLMLAGFYLLMITFAFSAPPADDGKLIFTSRCASCHQVNKIVVGPALSGVGDRRTEEWIIRFVHSSQTVIKSGDTTAAGLYEKFNKVPMPDHPDLTAENIKSILVYIREESKKPAENIGFRPEKFHPAYTPVTNWKFYAGYLVLVLILAAAMMMLVRVKEIQRK